MSGPRVSVLLPCFDAEAHVDEALSSILAEDRVALEVVAVDDGSGDGTGAILAERAARDPRVRVLRNPENRGLIASLNRALDGARAPHVARMDSDDVSVPGRLARQLRFLDDHPAVAGVGTGIEEVDAEGRPLRRPFLRARTPEEVRFLALFGTPVAHGSLMARTEALRRYRYREDPACLHAEDYDLFARMLRGGERLANVDEVLYRRRVRPGSVSRRWEDVQIGNFLGLAREHLTEVLGVRAPDPVHAVAVNRNPDRWRPRELAAGIALVDRVAARFLEESGGDGDPAPIRDIASQQKFDILTQAILKGAVATRATASLLAVGQLGALGSPPVRRHLAGKL